MKTRTRGEVEAELIQAVVKFEKEYLGRGPLEARAFIIQDMILIRLKGLMTPAEKKLTESREGQILVKETRWQLFDIPEDWVKGRLLSSEKKASCKVGRHRFCRGGKQCRLFN